VLYGAAVDRANSADQFDLAQPPFLGKERLERAVEAKDREPTLAGRGLNPVATAILAPPRSVRGAPRFEGLPDVHWAHAIALIWYRRSELGDCIRLDFAVAQR